MPMSISSSASTSSSDAMMFRTPDIESLPLPVSRVLRRTPEVEYSPLPVSRVLVRAAEVEHSPLPFRGENSSVAGSATSSTLTLVDVNQRTAPRASRAVRLREWIYEKFPRFAAFTGIARANRDAANTRGDLAVAEIDLGSAKIELAVARHEVVELTKELETAKRSARISEYDLKDTSKKLQIERELNDKLLGKVESLQSLMGSGLEWDESYGTLSGRASSEGRPPLLNPPVIVRPVTRPLSA